MLQHPDQDMRDTRLQTQSRSDTTSTPSSPITMLHARSGVVKTSKIARRQTKAACLGCRQRKSKVSNSYIPQNIIYTSHTPNPPSLAIHVDDRPVRRKPSILQSLLRQKIHLQLFSRARHDTTASHNRTTKMLQEGSDFAAGRFAERL